MYIYRFVPITGIGLIRWLYLTGISIRLLTIPEYNISLVDITWMNLQNIVKTGEEYIFSRKEAFQWKNNRTGNYAKIKWLIPAIKKHPCFNTAINTFKQIDYGSNRNVSQIRDSLYYCDRHSASNSLGTVYTKGSEEYTSGYIYVWHCSVNLILHKDDSRKCSLPVVYMVQNYDIISNAVVWPEKGWPKEYFTDSLVHISDREIVQFKDTIPEIQDALISYPLYHQPKPILWRSR